MIRTLYSTLFILSLLWTACTLKSSSDTQKRNPVTPIIGRVVKHLEQGIPIVFQDKAGHYWFGGKETGVYSYNGQELVLFDEKDGLSNAAVRGIQEDAVGNIYVETTSNVYQFNGQQWLILPLSKQKEWKLESNDLWFRRGGKEAGVFRYDGDSLHLLQLPQSKWETNYYKNNSVGAFSPYGVYSLYQDSKGHLWIGTSTFGVCYYNGQAFNWIEEEELAELDSGPASGVRAILEDQAGNFWFSNYLLSGYEVEAEGLGFSYKSITGIDTAATEGLDSDYMDIEQDQAGNFWLLTYDNGVWCYNGQQVQHYPVKRGAKNVLLFSIYKDQQGTLWLGTHNDGVYYFDGKSFVPWQKNKKGRDD